MPDFRKITFYWNELPSKTGSNHYPGRDTRGIRGRSYTRGIELHVGEHIREIANRKLDERPYICQWSSSYSNLRPNLTWILTGALVAIMRDILYI